MQCMVGFSGIADAMESLSIFVNGLTVFVFVVLAVALVMLAGSKYQTAFVCLFSLSVILCLVNADLITFFTHEGPDAEQLDLSDRAMEAWRTFFVVGISWYLFAGFLVFVCFWNSRKYEKQQPKYGKLKEEDTPL